MWMFWIFAGLFAAAAAALVMARAGAAAKAAASGGDDPALAVHRRQLAELDEAAASGLLGPEELRAARAEAGRRLLKTADAKRMTERPGGRISRFAAVLVAVGAAGLALAGYLLLGAPGLPDQPYAARLEGWRRADPSTLDPERMAAVLQGIVKERPHDPLAWRFLGRAELAAGQPYQAAHAFHTAALLAPDNAELLTSEGEALLQDNGGKPTPAATSAFRQALQRDPNQAAARYFLAREQIAGGDVAGGLAGWKALFATLSPDDPRRASLGREIAQVQASGRLGGSVRPPPGALLAAGGGGGEGAAAAASLAAGPPGAFIRAMVERQAAELKAHPDNPAGWARLVRSYRVLGDKAAEAQALAEARRLFANRPAAIKTIEAEAPVG